MRMTPCAAVAATALPVQLSDQYVNERHRLMAGILLGHRVCEFCSSPGEGGGGQGKTEEGDEECRQMIEI